MSALCAYPSDAFSLTSFTCDERQSHFSYPSMHGYQAAAAAPVTYAAACWPGSEEPQPRSEPAAKRRCLDKSRPAWPQMWAGSSTSSAASFCLGCAACQQQQQQQGQGGDRRPLQERHQNRLFGEAAVLAAAAAAAWAKNKEMLMSRPCTSAGAGTLFRRQLSVDPKKDYSAPLFVDCSVEYDLPRVVRPPPGAQPLLIKANSVAPRYPNNNNSLSSSSSAPWNSTHFDWFAKNEKSGKNVVKSALNHHSQRPSSLDQIHLAVAAPAPHLLPVPSNGSVRSSGACGCPSCLGRYWSPPVGATAAAAAAGLTYQQPTMIPFMAPYVDHHQTTANNNNNSSSSNNNSSSSTTTSTSTRRGSRKRSSTAAHLEPVYPAWMGGASAELVFNSGRMVAPWMTSQAPLKFSC